MTTDTEAREFEEDSPLSTDDRSTVAGAAMLMATMILGSRITGLARLVVIAYLFGQSRDTDAYVASFIVPDFIYFLISGGALATGFVPVFTDYLTRGDYAQARRTFRATGTLLCVVLLAVIGLCWGLAPQLVRLTSPGFANRPYEWGLATRLTRIILPAQFFFVLGGLFAGTLNSLRLFLVPAMQPLIYNCGIIAGGLLLGPRIGVAGLSWGALTGAFIGAFLLQIPVLVKRGVSFRPLWEVSHPGLRRVAGMVLPIILGLSISQIVANLLPRSLASLLAAGSITVIENANRLMQMPVAVFASGTAIALLPGLTEMAARGELSQLRTRLTTALRVVWMLALPAMAALVILRYPIIRLLLEHGDFGTADTQLVAQALICYAAAILGMSTQQIVSRGFYALQDSRTPVVIGIGAISLFVLIAVPLIGPLGHRGLALAASASAIANATALCVALRTRIGGLELRAALPSLRRFVLATAAAACVAWAADTALAYALAGDALPIRLVRVALPLLAGVAVYAGWLRAAATPEFQLLLDNVRRRGATADGA